MDVDRFFRRVIDKIVSWHDRSQHLFVDLYNWGSRRCTPTRGDCDGTQAALTSARAVVDLNVFPGRARCSRHPDYLRVSLSGYYNETYQRTHCQR